MTPPRQINLKEIDRLLQNLEPGCRELAGDSRFIASLAISFKRIADSLTRNP